MIKIKLLITFLFFTNYIFAQSYVLNSFQAEYDSLVNYHSLVKEIDDQGGYAIFWTHEFDLTFDFPFYNTTYNYLSISDDAVGRFVGASNFTVYLFSGNYRIDDYTDPDSLYSDIRYQTTEVNGTKIFKLEYHNVYFSPEYFEAGKNHIINFQIWFYETGTIEVHFGNIDLDECSYYFPGQGFSFFNNNPDGWIYGPWVSINNSGDTETACFGGDHIQPEISFEDSSCNVLTSIPPEGFVIQFKPQNSSAFEESTNIIECNIEVQANKLTVTKPTEIEFQSMMVYDVMGRLVAVTDQPSIDLPSFPKPIIVLVNGGNKRYSKTIWKE